MPPFPGFYNSAFQATGHPAAGFDVLQNGYITAPVEANRTVREIPWAQTYSVVIQRGGINALVRRYRALVYTEADFLALALLVNLPGGVLTTPREPNPTAANLDSIDREAPIDWTTIDGPCGIQLAFLILQ